MITLKVTNTEMLFSTLKTARIRTLLGLLLATYLSPAMAGYDVSYLWHRQLPSVELYMEKVGHVLGPGVSEKLRIVQQPGIYGLIYFRNGSSSKAVQVAKVHTRLLRTRGLERAAAVKSVNWNFVDTNSKNTSKPTPPAKKAIEAAPPVVQKPLATSKTNSVPKAPIITTSAAKGKKASLSSEQARELELAIEKKVKRLRAKGLIAKDERTAWSVYDFTSGEKLVDINEDAVFQGASLVKPFFAMAYFHQVKKGSLKFGSTSRRHMERMIQRSNNHSTNWILRKIGGPRAVQKILKNNYPNIFQETRIVEYIPAGGRTYRNRASVHDYSRFLYALWKGEIPGAKEIKRMMALPGKDRLFTGAKSIPKGTKVYNKTGSTARLCGDMGILVVKDKHGNRYPYTLVGIIEKDGRARNYTSWIRSRGNIIREISNIVYRSISRQHNLSS
ncbi:MAG: beta-lactamase class A [Parasphingorhabdus sp.]